MTPIHRKVLGERMEKCSSDKCKGWNLGFFGVFNCYWTLPKKYFQKQQLSFSSFNFA